MVSTLFPGSGIADLRRTQHASGVAGATVLGNDVVRRTRAAASSGCYGANALAFLTLYADLAYRLDALGDGVVGRGLGANSPQGQYGSMGRQHLLD
ncbi:hypothetical protein D9M71_316450 [compost metagenome]